MIRYSGFALVTVLIGLAILSLIVATVASSARISAIAVHAQIDALQAETIADAAVALTELELTDRRSDRRPRIDGVPSTVTILGTTMTVAVQDEYGKIDLNRADGSLLARLFQSEGLDAADASSLAARVLDWRQNGSGLHLQGATDEDYARAGYDYRPRRGPFETIGELKLVMGMTEELFDRIEPGLTIYSGQQSVNPLTAPIEVLLALPGYDPSLAKDTVARREETGSPIGSRLDPSAPLAGRSFSLHIRTTLGTRLVNRSMTIRVTSDPLRPFWMLASGTGANASKAWNKDSAVARTSGRSETTPSD